MTTPLLLARKRIKDAFDSIELLRGRLANASEAQLAIDDVLTDACCYRVVVIGEAIEHARIHAEAAFAQVKPEKITWDGVIQIRNGFVHQYAKATAAAVFAYRELLDPLENALGRVLGLL